MSWVAVGVTSVGIAYSEYKSGQVSSAQDKALGAQERATRASIEEQRRQFDEVRELLSPYVEAGDTALSQQLSLIGLGGEEEQRQAIEQLEASPQFEALTRQGEEAILQGASATGGLRGGNTQAALAQYRPQVLSGLIESQYNKLGGLANVGQSSAAGVGAAGQQTGSAISNLLQQQGASQASAAIAQGQTQANRYDPVIQGLSMLASNYRPQPTAQPYSSNYQFNSYA